MDRALTALPPVVDDRQGAGRVAAPDRTWLVAVAAALWGTDALLRVPLAGALPAATVVFWEHLIIVLLLTPFLPSAVRAFRAAPIRDAWAFVVIGAGASAIATALFTQAFRFGDPVTPLVLQKLQPLIAVAVAALLLGERMRAGYWIFAVPALAGAWLMAFPNPLDVAPSALTAALLAVGAAALWAVGTVLGRMVSVRTASRDVTVLRFAIGLPAALVVLLVQGAPIAVTPRPARPAVPARADPRPARADALLRRPAHDHRRARHAGRDGVPGDGRPDRRHPARRLADGDAVGRHGRVIVLSVTALGLRERRPEPVVTPA